MRKMERSDDDEEDVANYSDGNEDVNDTLIGETIADE
jgi:hypothetical protein